MEMRQYELVSGWMREQESASTNGGDSDSNTCPTTTTELRPGGSQDRFVDFP